jgi:hypothetical protein
MLPRNSAFWGNYYHWRDAENNELMLVANIEPMDGEPIELQHPELNVLLYVSIYGSLDTCFYDIQKIIPTARAIKDVSYDV